jgi:hypothetical protein
MGFSSIPSLQMGHKEELSSESAIEFEPEKMTL